MAQKIYLRRDAAKSRLNAKPIGIASQINAQQQAVVNEVTEVYQPIQRGKFLKTTSAKVGTSNYMLIIGNWSESVITVGNKNTDNNHVIIQEQTQAPHIIRRLKLSVTNADALTTNPELRYKTADGNVQNTPIDIQKYLNEYQYKTKLLTIPLRFVLDSRFGAFVWDLSEISAATPVDSATVIMDIEKVIGQVTSI